MVTWTLAHLDVIAPELGMLVIGAVAWAIPWSRRYVERAGRCAKALASDRRLPRLARYGLVFSVLPWPGPVDEIVGGLIVLTLLRSAHRATVLEVWSLS